MKIIFLGTGAVDWDINRHKSMEGFRRNSSVLIDDCLLIDPNADVADALSVFQKDPNQIRYIINTHKHSDHYNEDTIASLENAEFYPMVAGDVLQFDKYTVKALRANHSPRVDTVHFIITDGEKTIFYGLDGAWLTYDEVAEIKRNQIDFAVFDATIGNVQADCWIFEHNNLAMVLEIKKALGPYIKRFCISHMSRALHTSHKELVEYMSKHNVDVAFDGYQTVI